MNHFCKDGNIATDAKKFCLDNNILAILCIILLNSLTLVNNIFLCPITLPITVASNIDENLPFRKSKDTKEANFEWF